MISFSPGVHLFVKGKKCLFIDYYLFPMLLLLTGKNFHFVCCFLHMSHMAYFSHHMWCKCFYFHTKFYYMFYDFLFTFLLFIYLSLCYIPGNKFRFYNCFPHIPFWSCEHSSKLFLKYDILFCHYYNIIMLLSRFFFHMTFCPHITYILRSN